MIYLYLTLYFIIKMNSSRSKVDSKKIVNSKGMILLIKI